MWSGFFLFSPVVDTNIVSLLQLLVEISCSSECYSILYLFKGLERVQRDRVAQRAATPWMCVLESYHRGLHMYSIHDCCTTHGPCIKGDRFYDLSNYEVCHSRIEVFFYSTQPLSVQRKAMVWSPQR